MGLLYKLFGGGKKSDGASGGNSVSYRTGPGDTCRSLAKRFYGSESEWQRIYDANARVIKDEVQSGSDPMLVGTELTVPNPKYDASGQPVTA